MDPERGRPGGDARHPWCPRHPRLRWRARWTAHWPALPLALSLSLLPLALAGPAAAQSAPETEAPASADELATLRAEIAEMRDAYEAKIEALEERLAALEGSSPAAEAAEAPPATGEDDLAALRAAAQAAAGQGAVGVPEADSEAPPEVATTQPTFGRSDLNRLNPEISFTGDFVGKATWGGRSDPGSALGDDRDEFRAREFELDLQSALDPYSRTRFTLAFDPEGNVDLEEGYITYNALPGGTGLVAGKFRQQFGVLNRQHTHALPQSDYPLVLQTYFGDEGLAQTGLSGHWLLPHAGGWSGWANATELTLQVTDGESEAFGGERFQDFSGLVHLKSYWDLSDAAYFEWGLSSVTGKTEDGRSRRIYGTDFTFHWQPPTRAKYRELTWRTEVLLSDLDLDPALSPDPGSDDNARAWGAYTYVEGLLAQNLYAGARLDWVEDPLDPENRTWGVVPYVTWWQSEFVRLRGEYRYFEEDLTDRSHDALLLQLTWAAGPHKHETY